MQTTLLLAFSVIALYAVQKLLDYLRAVRSIGSVCICSGDSSY